MKLSDNVIGYLKAIALIYLLAPDGSEEERAVEVLWCSAIKRLGITADQAEEFLEVISADVRRSDVHA